MSAVWAALGAIMGASLGMSGGGLIGAIAGMIAGIVELAALGAVFALLGGRPQETILGATGGLLGSLAVGMLRGPAPIIFVANFGMIYGAIIGATLQSYIRLVTLPITLLGRLLRRFQRPVVIVHPHEGLGEHRSFGPTVANMALQRRHASISSE
jgi:hypothetical protein